jgi:hypothetical protein
MPAIDESRFGCRHGLATVTLNAISPTKQKTIENHFEFRFRKSIEYLWAPDSHQELRFLALPE